MKYDDLLSIFHTPKMTQNSKTRLCWNKTMNNANELVIFVVSYMKCKIVSNIVQHCIDLEF